MRHSGMHIAAVFLGCSLGCGDATEVHAVASADHSLSAAGALSLNGTYGAGCNDRGGAWSVELASGASLTYPELAVVRADADCVLTLTALVADQTYSATPPIVLTNAYQASASQFTAGGVAAFYANGKLDTTTFADDFAIDVVASADPDQNATDVITKRTAKLFWFGDGSFYQGAYDAFERVPVQELTAATTWNAIATGNAHSCGVRTDGTLWCWGVNASGQLGIGTLVTQYVPIQVGTATTWKNIATGTSHTCATRTDGTLWCWGLNTNGQLGNGGTVSPQTTPVQVGTATTWADVATGDSHTCATRAEGTLWCWGNSDHGQVGAGSLIRQVSPIQIGTSTDWKSPSSRAVHTCATRTDGTLWCWGYNGRGENGIGSFVTPQTSPVRVGSSTNWSVVSAGGAHSCGVRTTGTLWCWGFGGLGELGLGTLDTQTSPMQVGTATTWASVASGYWHTCATRTDGTLWCWGYNANGQLGIENLVMQTTPQQVGASTSWSKIASGSIHTCSARANGTIWCWGNSGELGIGDRRTSSSSVQVGSELTWRTIGVGFRHTCAIKMAGTLWCWGLNNFGQVGDGTLVNAQTGPTQIGTSSTWSTVVADQAHTCATRTDGTLWCWGWNASGQVGTGNVVSPQTNPLQVSGSWGAVGVGYAHTCGIRSTGTLWCWGWNVYGQIGNGNVVDPQATLQQIGTDSSWQSLGIGGAHSCAIRTDGTLWCWGHNGFGQLGIGNVVTPITTPTQVGTDANWRTVTSGSQHTCATKTNGTLWCWGRNLSGQVGNGNVVSPQPSPVQVGTNTTWNGVAAGAAHSCGTRTDRSVWCWGDNAAGIVQATPVQGTGTVLAVFLGSETTTTFTIRND